MMCTLRTSLRCLTALIALQGAFTSAQGQPESKSPLDWRTLEAPTLARQTQLTFPDRFVKAGEAYFSPGARWIIFQAVSKPAPGAEPAADYSMFIARLRRDAAGHITGTDEPIQLSPPGSANTCGFFHPTQPWRIIFGSTLTAPSSRSKAGYQRGSGRYLWKFPVEMEVCSRSSVEVYADMKRDSGAPAINWGKDAREPTPIWRRNGYDAECAYSSDGRFIVYTAVEPKTNNGDIYIYDTQTKQSHAIVVAPGYDGGPFFSPDGKRLCYRSDRRGDDLLQLFVADLKFDDQGAAVGVEREHQLTDDQNVNWAPFWHPSGAYLIFTTSRISHANYEVFSIRAPAMGDDSSAPGAPRRLTSASGFDGMPVFNDDGALMMWTSQRGAITPGEARPSSQIWIAEVVDVEPR